MSGDISERTLHTRTELAVLESRVDNLKSQVAEHEQRLDRVEQRLTQLVAYATGAAAVIGVLWTLVEKFA